MTGYIIRRLLQAIPTLIGVSIISFVLAHAAPGDPITFRTFDPSATEESREILRKQLGLDQPLPVQYFNWFTGLMVRRGDRVEELTSRKASCNFYQATNLTLCNTGGGVIRGQLGTSIDTNEAVWDRLKQRMPATLELTVAGLLFSMIIGIPLGVLSAVYRGSIFDNIVRFLTAIGQSVPNFWMGLLVIYFFGVFLRILPTGGRGPVSLTGDVPLWERLDYLILPMFVLAFGGIAGFSRIMRTEVLEVINTDYVRTARAKGLAPNVVLYGHAFRNALLPLMTILGPAFLGLLGGAVVTETIFSWPGMGRLTLNAVLQQDFPLVLGSVMFFSVFVILGNLLSDILYGIVDPRVHLS